MRAEQIIREGTSCYRPSGRFFRLTSARNRSSAVARANDLMPILAELRAEGIVSTYAQAKTSVVSTRFGWIGRLSIVSTAFVVRVRVGAT